MKKIWNIPSIETNAMMKKIREEIAGMVSSEKRISAITIFEEIYTNIAKYGYAKEEELKPVQIEFISNHKGSIFLFTDSGIYFNPITYTPLPLSNDRIGGHGIRIVKELSKRMQYTRTFDGKNKLQIIF